MNRQWRTIGECRHTRAAFIAGLLAVSLALISGCANDDQHEASSKTSDSVATRALTSTAARGPIEVTAIVSSGDIIVGEKLNLTIEVTASQGVQVDMPVIEQQLGAFTVRRRQTPPDVPEGDIRRWSHSYVLDTFATGAVDLPSLEVQYTDARSATVAEHGEPLTGMLVTDSITIQVASVLSGSETDEDYRDIRGAVDVPIASKRTWIAILVGAAVAAVTSAVVALLLILVFRKRATDAQRQAPMKPAHVIALAELDQLESEQLIEADRQHEFYSRLSDIVRQYVERRFGLMAPERTTDEFLREAGRDPRLSHEHRELLADFLRAADMVKFACFAPPAEDAATALHRARGFVHDTALRSDDPAENAHESVKVVA